MRQALFLAPFGELAELGPWSLPWFAADPRRSGVEDHLNATLIERATVRSQVLHHRQVRAGHLFQTLSWPSGVASMMV
jgi:hypothetical protein